MSAELNLFLTNQTKHRQLVFWRVGALVAFCSALVISMMGHSGSVGSNFTNRPHIVRLTITGVVQNNVSQIVRALKQAQSAPDVTGLLLVVDSPGGGVTGGERLHDAIKRFAAVKPVSVSMGDMGASAAYMLSVPAQHIVALPSTLTGSIGVIFQRPDVSVGLGRLGIGVDAITSGAMKDQTDPTSALTPEGRQMLQGIVNDLFAQFVSMVADGRHLTEEKVRSMADGRAYTGRQAIALGLVDELGDEDAARLWLRKRLNIGTLSYPVLPLMPERSRRWYEWPGKKALLTGLLGGSFSSALDREGLDGAVAILQL
ncbi:signal peptide peptidase SppA [Gluconobacter kondonii]|uniref:signal peptide peptidase SppA n=1 Tax=Gluconobacter kondonii TaxID=941463 RepID=UPI001B8B9281|nr:signal peptide peptidase SppA [Gluconobacter kondonii]MBS1064913.1 signal peptide peptidase SppA [Gluconobacter kondonii]